jgi:hypothetical protein
MNTSYEKFSFYNNYFGGSIEGDNIISTDFYGNKQIVGVTTKKHQETVELLNSYYNKLVDMGVIEKEKTPEDIAKEQQQMMQTMMLQMQTMQQALNELQQNKTKGEEHEHQPNIKNDGTEIKYESNSTKQFESINRKGKGDTKFSKQSN